MAKLTVQQKFQDARECLNAAFIDRETPIDLVLTGLLCKENCLFVSPPGTGKSYLLDTLARWVEVQKFTYLMTKFTDTSELFGPVDVPSLMKGEQKRCTEGYLADAYFAFLDEIWKSGSAVANTLIKWANHEAVTYGLQKIKSNLLTLVAASNEYPNDDNGGKELSAMLDRFLLRFDIQRLTTSGRAELARRAIDGDKFEAEFRCSISLKEIQEAQYLAEGFTWTQKAEEVFQEILKELAGAMIFASERRIVKTVKAVQAYAFLQGGDKVHSEHLEVCAHTLWDDPEEQPAKTRKIVMKLTCPEDLAISDAKVRAEDVLLKCKPGLARDKLLDIQDDLKKLPKSGRRDRAVNHIADLIEKSQRLSIGRITE